MAPFLQQVLGVIVTAAIAAGVFFITRPMLDPADMPNAKVSGTSSIDRIRSEKGIHLNLAVLSKQGEEKYAAPKKKEEVPGSLEIFFKNGGFCADPARIKDVLSKRLINKYDQLYNIIPSQFTTKTDVVVTWFTWIPNAVLVREASGSDAMIFVLIPESGYWKIDNCIPKQFYNSFLSMDVTNWNFDPMFDYAK